MTAINAYTTRKAFLDWITPTDTTPNTIEDSVIDAILESVSRFMDLETGRHFYPVIETRSFDIPDDYTLYIDDSLLEVVTLTNGDDTTIASTEYNLLPPNYYPKYALKLKGSTSVSWEADSNGDVEQVIDLAAVYGYHEDYSKLAWKSITTLSEDLDTSEVAFDLASASLIHEGHILRIGNEICIASSKASNTVTVLKRADNGSTAATHTTGDTVYVWQPMSEIEQSCKTIAHNVYRRFGGQAGQDENIVTASGVVITPRDIPTLAAITMARLKRVV